MSLSAQEAVTFKDLSGVDYDPYAESITKTGTVGWNAGAYSVNCLRVLSDGTVSVGGLQTNKLFAVGLSSMPSGYDVTRIDYCFEFNNGIVVVKEGGTQVYSHGSYTNTDQFELVKTSGVMSYKINGNVIYTSSSTVSSDLTLDIALHDVGTKLGAVMVTFKRCFLTTGDNYGSVQRELDDTYYLTHNHVLKVKFEEEYFAGIGEKITYNIYDDQNVVVASVDYAGSPSSGAPNLPVQEGDNRFGFNLSGLGLTGNDFYTMEIINKKHEKRYLHFKYITP